MKNILLIIVVFLVIGGAVSLVVHKSKVPETNPVLATPDQPQAKMFKKEPDTKEWKTYENKDVGISFKYPAIFDRVDAHIINGETGRVLTGVLEFMPNHWISFGGATEDFTWGKGGSLTDTYGYKKKGEKYFLKFIWGDNEVIPSEFLPVNGGNDQAILIRDKEINQMLSSKAVAVFVNIPNSPFQGLVFMLCPTDGRETVDEKEVDILRQIVSSVTFI